jgi:tetratricopeptide (TPR) repeat protein
MKASYFYITFLGVFFCMFSCKNSQKNHIEKEMDHEIKLYHQAIKFGDVGTAIHAMQSLLVWDSSHSSYYDTLAVLYFHSQNYAQAVQAAQEVLDKNSDNEKILQVAAHGCQYLERFDMAIVYYTKLATVKPSPIVNYELASCYFYLKDFKKVSDITDKIMADKNSDTAKVNITFNQGHDQQEVPVKAACYNMLGTLSMNEHQKDKAIENYKKALEIFPDFRLAKQNEDFIVKSE